MSIRSDTALLCALVVVAPQLLGGAFPWSVIAIVALALAALAMALWVTRIARPRLVDGLWVVMALAWCWTCAQAVPLPHAVASALSLPSVATSDTLAALEWGTDVPLTISTDPGSTQLQILIGIGILSAFLAGRLGGPRGLRPIAIAMVASALLLALEGAFHRIAGVHAVFGAYTPRFSQPQLLTPLMNGNHLGGVALVGSLLSAGLAIDGESRHRRAWGLASVACALTVAFTLSRGAIGSLLFGFLVLGAWLPGRARNHRQKAWIPALVVVAAAVGTAVFAGLEPILRRFETQSFDKLAVASRGFRLLEGSSWWLGIGRGAFSTTFVSEEGSLARFTHPENLIVQWATEWGVPLATALILALLLTTWRRLRDTEQSLVAAACIALAALALQNMVDFSLEMAGVVVPIAALLGALLPAPDAMRSRVQARWAPAACAVFVAVFVVVAPRVWRADTQTLIDRLTQQMVSDDEQAFIATLRRGLSLHPTEPAFALLAGTFAGSKGEPDAPRWLSLAMERAPGWAAPHATTARWLLEGGRLDQALLEIREAETRHPGSARAQACDVLARGGAVADLLKAAPPGAGAVPFLDRAAACPGTSFEVRMAIDEAILQRVPHHPSAVLRTARRQLARGFTEAGIAMLERAVRSAPTDRRLWVALIRADLDRGEIERAERRLVEARQEGIDGRPMTEVQARIEGAAGRTDAMRETLSRLRGESRGEARLLAASFLVQGELEASLGNVEDALAAYAAADRVDPSSPGLQRGAELALSSGRRTQARRLFEALCLRRPGSNACSRATLLSKEAAEPPDAAPNP